MRKFGIVRPPVPVRKIAEWLGVEIVEMTLPSWFFGVLLNIDDDQYIALNKCMPEHRKNFTIGHEIAHHQIHSGELAYMKNCKRDYYHREADAFAAELCMPTFMVKEEAAKWFNDYRFMAGVFEIGETAMVRKLTELGMLKDAIYDCKS